MTVKSKKILAGMAAGAIMAFTSLTVAAATPSLPSGSQTWRAKVGYGNVNAGNMIKNNYDNDSHFSFTRSPENIKVWLTTYINYDGNKEVASQGVLVEYNKTASKQTTAVKWDEVYIEASREHIGDAAFVLGGEWLA